MQTIIGAPTSPKNASKSRGNEAQFRKSEISIPRQNEGPEQSTQVDIMPILSEADSRPVRSRISSGTREHGGNFNPTPDWKLRSQLPAHQFDRNTTNCNTYVLLRCGIADKCHHP